LELGWYDLEQHLNKMKVIGNPIMIVLNRGQPATEKAYWNCWSKSLLVHPPASSSTFPLKKDSNMYSPLLAMMINKKTIRCCGGVLYTYTIPTEKYYMYYVLLYYLTSLLSGIFSSLFFISMAMPPKKWPAASFAVWLWIAFMCQ